MTISPNDFLTLTSLPNETWFFFLLLDNQKVANIFENLSFILASSDDTGRTTEQKKLYI